MTEHSRFWDGTSTGDASDAPYDFGTELSQVLSALSGAEGLAGKGGVFRDAVNKYTPTFSANQITIDTGLGLAYGNWHYNDAALNIAIPASASGTRVDRIVLRKDWTAQTTRLTRIAGVIGAGVPALGAGTPAYTQTVGSVWDVPLFQIQITIGGSGITPTLLVDERVYLPVHGDQENEGGTKHSYGQISGTPTLYDGTPAPSTPGVAGSAGVSTQPSRGDHIHALAAPLLAIMGSNQDFPTSTLSNVTDLVIAVAASKKYLVEGILFTVDVGVLNAGLNLVFVVPAGAVMSFDAIGMDPTTDLVLISGAASGAQHFGTSTVVQAVHFRGTLVMGGTPGNLQMQVCTINAGTTRLQTASHMHALAQ